MVEHACRTALMSGQISPEICNLDRLTTLVVANWKSISGTNPSCITSLPALRILVVVGNRLSGPTVLNVADNQISREIPASLPDLSSLMHLDLSGNRISGQIPKNFGKLQMLSRALLARNQLSGEIPRSIYRLANLDLSGNRISGSITAEIGGMTVLSSLYLDGNQISGGVPASLLQRRG